MKELDRLERQIQLLMKQNRAYLSALLQLERELLKKELTSKQALKIIKQAIDEVIYG